MGIVKRQREKTLFFRLCVCVCVCMFVVLTHCDFIENENEWLLKFEKTTFFGLFQKNNKSKEENIFFLIDIFNENI